MRFLGIAVAVATLTVAAPASATTLLLTIDGTYSSIYYLATNRVQRLPTPIAYTATVTLPLDAYTSDYVADLQQTATVFDTTGLRTHFSLLDGILPDPIGNGLTDPPNEVGALAGTGNYAPYGGLIGNFTMHQSWRHRSATQLWQVDTFLNFGVTKLGPATTTEPPVFTPDLAATYFRSRIGQPVIASVGWAFENNIGGTVTYLDGYSFPDISATLRSVDLVSDAPEPGTWEMFIGGFGLVGATVRRRPRTVVRLARV